MNTVPMHAVSKRRLAGFTLVELLVVIAIIAVLVSFLLPAMRGARNAADRVACQSNMRQYGLAISMYLNDSKGWYPSYYTWKPDGTLDSTNILTPLYRTYVKGSSVFQSCPSAPQLRGNPSSEAYRTHYGFPYASLPTRTVLVQNGTSNKRAALRVTMIPNASVTCALAETRYGTVTYFTDGWGMEKFAAASVDTAVPPIMLKDRHAGSGNYLFVDGHVESFTARQVTERATNKLIKFEWLPGEY